jgi:Leucine-rich repeat (LRR) protein
LRGLHALDSLDNLLDGVIPIGIEALYDLKGMNLSTNRFPEQLPGDIGGCFLLKLVDFTHFSENLLTGSIPESMQRLSSCTSLSLRENLFTREIPDWIGELRDLKILDILANRFSSQIPISIGNLPVLKNLNLSMNQFTNCINLLAIDVSHNQLVGNIHLTLVYLVPCSS